MKRSLAILLALVLILPCSGMAQVVIKVDQVPVYGKTLDIEFRTFNFRRRLVGELLAIEGETLYFMPDKRLQFPMKEMAGPGGELRVSELYGFIGIQRSDILRIIEHPGPLSTGQVVGWGLAGTLGTISNGFGLILTAPLWLLTWIPGAITTSLHTIEWPPQDDWSTLRLYGRFPGGLPDSYRASIETLSLDRDQQRVIVLKHEKK